MALSINQFPVNVLNKKPPCAFTFSWRGLAYLIDPGSYAYWHSPGRALQFKQVLKSRGKLAAPSLHSIRHPKQTANHVMCIYTSITCYTMRHNWQDNMNFYENQRWNQVFRKGPVSLTWVLIKKHISSLKSVICKSQREI